jgi:hypothetical protein
MMATLTPFGDADADLPEVQCSECDVIFTVIWQRNGFTDGIDYCPFCGSEIERGNV